MRTNGRISIPALLTIIVVAAGIYWAVFIGPLYMERFDVSDAANVAYAQLATGGAESARANMLVKLARIGTHFEISEEDGIEREVPGIGIDDENALTVSNENGERIVSLRYKRTIVLWPSKERYTEDFYVEKRGTGAK